MMIASITLTKMGKVFDIWQLLFCLYYKNSPSLIAGNELLLLTFLCSTISVYMRRSLAIELDACHCFVYFAYFNTAQFKLCDPRLLLSDHRPDSVI